MDEKLCIGIDIGATKANIGLITGAGRVVETLRVTGQERLEPQEYIRMLCEQTARLLAPRGLKPGDLSFIGVGVPGTADYQTGMVEYCPNLGWEDVPAGDLFAAQLGVPVRVAQDSRLAAWAEYLLGAGRGYHSIFCLTLGTGIGCGIILDGKIFHGALNTAGELGHSVLYKDGRPCSCGNHGCLERYTSGTGIAALALEACPEKFAERPPLSESVFELAYAGDAQMLALIRRAVEDLAVGVANAVSLLSPQAVIVSGGLCVHETLIIQPLRELVNHYGYHSWVRKQQLKIEKAQLGPEAPMVGAALFYQAIE